LTTIFDLPGHTPRKQKRLSGFDSRKDANLAHISFVANYGQYKNTSSSIEETSKEFETVFDEYLVHISHELKESTHLNIENNYHNHILPYFKGKKILAVKTSDVTELLIAIGKRGLSYSTKSKIKGILNRFFTYCADAEIIEINPCLKAIKLKNTDTQKEMLIWDESEFKTFIAFVDNYGYKIFFTLLYLTG
jgi:site-specific recombinase XerD